jgi:hypothetical protein
MLVGIKDLHQEIPKVCYKLAGFKVTNNIILLDLNLQSGCLYQWCGSIQQSSGLPIDIVVPFGFQPWWLKQNSSWTEREVTWAKNIMLINYQMDWKTHTISRGLEIKRRKNFWCFLLVKVFTFSRMKVSGNHDRILFTTSVARAILVFNHWSRT